MLADVVTSISPTSGRVDGNARLAAETPRQIANAHTIFNIANTMIFYRFTAQFARLVEWLIPDQTARRGRHDHRAKYLDDELLTTPSLALDRVRMEILHMGDQVRVMLQEIMPAIMGSDPKALEEIREMDERVDALEASIVKYLGKISRLELTEKQNLEFMRLMEAVNHLENIGDIVETNLVELGQHRLKDQLAISAPTREMLNDFHRVVTRAVDTAIQAVTTNDVEAADLVTDMKDEINPCRSITGRPPNEASGGRRTQSHRDLHDRNGYRRKTSADLLLCQENGEDRRR